MNNEQIISQILQNALIIFESSQYYNFFINHIDKKQFQQARYYLDIEMDSVNNIEENNIKYILYNATEDLLMDLIINEIEGAEGNNKQQIKYIRS